MQILPLLEKRLCPRCRTRERESFEGEYFGYCPPCNDRDYERSQERAEFNHYHPSEE